MQQRVYLDHAATTWPKPEAVYTAQDRFARQIGVAAGRGAYAESLQATQVLERTRTAVARLIHAENPQQVVLTSGGTASLNLAIHGWLQPDDHVVTTVTEHNSVLRPLQHWRRHGVRVTYVPCDAHGFVQPAAVRSAIQANTSLVIINHASNVTGAVQPIAGIAEQLKACNLPLLVDAAQSLGHVPLNVTHLGDVMLAAPGHKGLLGPLGTGVLYVSAGCALRLRPVFQGGTGTVSEQEQQPAELPHRLEAGSMNTPAIAGLEQGVQHVLGIGVAALAEREHGWTRDFLDAIQSLPGVRVLGPAPGQQRVGVVSVRLDACPPQEAAALLDSSFRIQTRAGLHCAPRMHAELGTLEQGGTLRLSTGATTQDTDLAKAAEALAKLGVM